MEKYLSIDKIENEIAFCEDDNLNTIQISTKLLPQAAREGDCLVELGDGSYIIDAEQTTRRRDYNKMLLQKLFDKNNNSQP